MAYKFYLDGDNLFSQFNGSGYDYVAGLYASPDTTNDYGSHKFEKEEVLDDNHGQPTTHVFTIAVVDQLGNKLEKKVIVHYDPNLLKLLLLTLIKITAMLIIMIMGKLL